jgi:hypothetical protein
MFREAVVGKDSVVTHTDPVAVKVASRTNGQESDIMDVEPPMKDPRMPVILIRLMDRWNGTMSIIICTGFI